MLFFNQKCYTEAYTPCTELRRKGYIFKRILSRKNIQSDNIRLCRVMKAVNPLLAGGCGEVKPQPFRIIIQTSSIFTNGSAPVFVLWITNISYHEHRRHILLYYYTTPNMKTQEVN